MLKKKFKKEWVAALRSGKFNQGSGALRDTFSDTETFCCLGVACHLLRPNLWQNVPNEPFKFRMNHGFDDHELAELDCDRPDFPKQQGAYMPKALAEEIGLTVLDQKRLVDMNDGSSTFDEIADYIEENL
jgi:hypothetical protein